MEWVASHVSSGGILAGAAVINTVIGLIKFYFDRRSRRG